MSTAAALRFACLAIALVAPDASAQFPAGWVTKQKKITENQNGLNVDLTAPALFGVANCSLGDLDGDGNTDLLVGAYVDNTTGIYTGSVYVLFMNGNGTVKSHVQITSNTAGFNVTLDPLDMFGWSVCNLGDVDGDGVVDVAVGAWLDDEPPVYDQGAIYILFLKPNGTVKRFQRITTGVGGFTQQLYTETRFGTSLTPLGDLDGDGVTELLAGAIYDNDAAYLGGTVYTLFLDKKGKVKKHVKITMGQSGFFELIEHQERFGYASTNLGDIDLDGVNDVAIGSLLENDGGPGRGAVYICFMRSDGWVKATQKISSLAGNFTGQIDDEDQFGCSLAALPDLNGDGVTDLAVGAITDDDGGTDKGAVWILNLNRNGTVRSHSKISATEGGFPGILLDPQDRFGQSIAMLGDLDHDGRIEIGIGADHDDDGGADAGALYLVSLAKGPWTYVNGGAKGSLGKPELYAMGLLVPGATTTIELSKAPTNALALGLFSTTLSTLTWGSATLTVPNIVPPGMWFAAMTDPTGRLTISDTWASTVPAGYEFYVQMWIHDPAAALGFAGTNMVKGTVP